MADKRWTFLVLEGDSAPLRQFTLRNRTLGLVAGISAFAILLLVGLTATLGIGGAARIENSGLERQNALLTGELEEIQDRLQGLESELVLLSQEGERFRAVAGLEAIDEEVLLVGVGGPGSPVMESHPLFDIDPSLGKKAFAVSYDLNALERRARLLAESLAEASDSVSAHHEIMEATPSILPTVGRLSSRFSNARLHPLHHRAMPHEGIDIAAPRGTPILAAAHGTVIYAGQRSGYGLMVELDHGFGHTTTYGHASTLLVRQGQKVARGDMIARVGNTGLATAPHLHYEVRVGGRPVNPLNYVIMGAVP